MITTETRSNYNRGSRKQAKGKHKPGGETYCQGGEKSIDSPDFEITEETTQSCTLISSMVSD
jgi:hypothetical protein